MRRASEIGVLIVAGSDAGSYGVAHGVGLLDELEHLAAAGVPALAVINSATGVGAARLRYRAAIGRLEAGASCRFIVTRHSPIEHIANLRRPRAIVFDGIALEGLDPAAAQGM